MKAPYAPGDPVVVLHDCAGHGTELATFAVERIKPLATFAVERIKPLATNGQWRITTTRCDGTQLDTEVDARGRDRHGYTYPPRKDPRP